MSKCRGTVAADVPRQESCQLWRVLAGKTGAAQGCLQGATGDDLP